MKYFLDFDRTLFDTDAFKVYLAERDGSHWITGEPEMDVAASLNDMVMSGALSFSPGELTRFVYPDVPGVLKRLGSHAVILTFGNAALQRLKVENALSGVYAGSALYTGDASKSSFVRAWPLYRGESAVFVDDRPGELAGMATEFPAMSLYEMRRDGGVGDGRWPVIHSLTELP